MPYRSALTRSFALALLAAPGLFAQATHAQTTPATALTPTSPEDFSYAYWLNGWRKYPGDERPDTLCFETSHYGLAINPADLAHPQFGRLTGETDYRARSVELIPRWRQEMVSALESLGCEVFPSIANYLLCRLPEQGPDADTLAAALAPAKILVRDCSDFAGLDKRFIRVAVNDEEDNRRLVEEMTRIFRG